MADYSRRPDPTPEAEKPPMATIKFNYTQTRYSLPPGDPLALATAMVEMKNFIDAVGLDGEVKTFYDDKTHVLTMKVSGERTPS